MRRNKAMYINKGPRRNKVNGKRVAGVVIGLSVLAGVGFAFMPNAYQVTINGEVVGALEKKEYVNTAIETVKAQLENTYDTKVTLEGVDQVKWVHASKKQMITPDYLASYLREKGDVELELRALKIDGEQIGIVKSDEVVDELLVALTEEYHDDETLKGKFTKEVTTEPVMAKESDLMDFEELVDVCTKTSKQQVTYVVEPGDVLSGIASKLNVNIASLLSANEGLTETSVLRIGQELKAEVKVPFLGVELIEEPKAPVEGEKAEGQKTEGEKVEAKVEEGKKTP